MRILTVTNMFPTARDPRFGIFVREQVESIRALGHDVDVLFVNGREGFLRYKGYALGFPRLWRAMGRARYDLIHAHYAFSGVITAAQARLPVVLTHHGVEVRDSFQGPVARWASRHSARVIVVAPWMSAFIPVPNVSVVPCGIDLDLFRPLDRLECRRRLGLDPDAYYALFAGYTSDPVKRFALARQSVELACRAGAPVELLAVTDRPHETIPLYMNAADALLLTSRYEGSAQVIKEAMACNLPIIATDAGDAWDVIGPTQGCHRVSSEPETIAAALRAGLAAEPAHARSDGRERVLTYGLEQTARKVVAVYTEALKVAPRPLGSASTAGSLD